MTYTTRLGMPADAPALAALHTASWRAWYGPYVPAGRLGAQLDTHMQARWETWPADRLVVVAEDAGCIVGFGAVVRGADPLLDNLHVDPGWQSRGIGAALLRGIAAHLASEGMHGFYLTVLEGNVAARRFYRRNGGQEGPVHDDRLLDHPVRVVPVRWSAPACAALAAEFASEVGKDA
ncbi:MAG: GNAT family N-acetyltransferase [Pseudomonadota bacterium]